MLLCLKFDINIKYHCDFCMGDKNLRNHLFQNIKLKCLQTVSEEDAEMEEITSTQQRNAEKVRQEIKRGFITQVSLFIKSLI